VRVAVFGRNPKMTLVRVVIWVVICLVVFKVMLVRVAVTGISMLPAYQDKSAHWVSRLAYVRHEPQRGDVVAIGERGGDNARLLFAPSVMFLKRVIGLPGETLTFAGGQVLINGKILDEPYEKLSCDWNLPPVKLEFDEYFVVGDNRSMPEQDHTKGVCKRYQIFGKILL
jgi:signal peptidase I